MHKARTPFANRIHKLRMAIRYSKNKFARVWGTATATYNSIEKGARPSIHLIRRLKIMERAFKEPLELYLSNPRKYGGWGKEEKVYGKYEGDLYTKKMVKFRSTNLLPLRQADIEALGGMAVFGHRRHTPESGE